MTLNTSTDGKKRLVLAGAGHAHLYTIKHAASFVQKGYEVVLIAPDNFYYSGLAPGVLGGYYTVEQDIIDVEQLITSAGGKFVKDYITKVDEDTKTLHLIEHEPITYDVLSFNIGSKIPIERIKGAETYGVPVKPIKNVLKAREDSLQILQSGNEIEIVIVGGGPSSVEFAANLQRLNEQYNESSASISLITRSSRLLKLFPRKAHNIVQNVFDRRGIFTHLNTTVKEVYQDYVLTNENDLMPYDMILYAIGVVPPSVFMESKLKTDKTGALVVNGYLQSVSDPHIFGVGDCIAFEPYPLQKVGVYAIREAPILFRNLHASLKGKSLQIFNPQKHFIQILNLGDGTGLLVRKRFVSRARLWFKLKDWIDRRFLQQYV